MQKCMEYYIYRGIWIHPMFGGWMTDREMCSGKQSGIPIYKALVDVKNAIDKWSDGTHKAEPRVIGTAGWNGSKQSYYKE